MAMVEPNFIENITCGICEERMKDPKMSGKCEHTYCKKCLDDWLSRQMPGQTFTCPYCRAVYDIPENGADGLPDNESVIAFIEKLDRKKGNADEKVKFCDPCKFRDCSTKASHYCGGCDGLYFCSSCYNVHQQSTKTSRHDILEICTDHSKVLKGFCLDCRKFVCMLCVHFEHSTDEHNLTPYHDALMSAKDEQREATRLADISLRALRKEKETVDQIDEVLRRKRDFWVREIGAKLSQKLLEFDKTINRLKKEREECEEKGSNDIQTILKCCTNANETKESITKLEHYYSNTIKRGGEMKIDCSEACVLLEEEFLKPARNLVKESNDKDRLEQCQEMVNNIQEILGRSAHEDDELKIASRKGSADLAKARYLDHLLLDNLSKAISPTILDELGSDLTEHIPCKSKKKPDIDDINALWSFMQSELLLALGWYNTLKDVTRKWIRKAEFDMIARTEEAIAVLAGTYHEGRAKVDSQIIAASRLVTFEFVPHCGTLMDVIFADDGRPKVIATKGGGRYVYTTAGDDKLLLHRLAETRRSDSRSLGRYEPGKLVVMNEKPYNLTIMTDDGQIIKQINVTGINGAPCDMSYDRINSVYYMVVRSPDALYLCEVDEGGAIKTRTHLRGFQDGWPRVASDARGRVCVSEMKTNGMVCVFQKKNNELVLRKQRVFAVDGLEVADICYYQGRIFCVGWKTRDGTFKLCELNDELEPREICFKDPKNEQAVLLKSSYSPRLDVSHGKVLLGYATPGFGGKSEIFEVVM